MSNLKNRILNHFKQSIDTKIKSQQLLADVIEQSCIFLANTLAQGNKILCCGNGGSAADAQHFAAELVNRFEIERPGLPAIALTTDSSILTSIANDYNYLEIFSKQIAALGYPKDCLIVISTSGNSKNILKAIETAHQYKLNVLALTGNEGGKIPTLLTENDLEIRVPASQTSRIQEMHLLILHCLCDGIDYRLFNYEK